MLDGLVFKSVRSLGRHLPLRVMLALLLPWALVRAVPPALLRARNNPPATLPPGARRASRRASISARVITKLNQAALLWSDEFLGPRWAGRFDASAMETIRGAAAERPVVVVTLHFGAFLLLPALIRLNGMPSATLIHTEYWPPNAWRRQRADLTRRADDPAYLRAGDARGALRYLTVGRCLLVAPDYAFGERAEVGYEGATLHLATSPLRLARIAGADVIPVLVETVGPWRYRVHVGAPMPRELLAGRDLAPAAQHIATELLPIAARRPTHVHGGLARAFAGSGSAT